MIVRHQAFAVVAVGLLAIGLIVHAAVVSPLMAAAVQREAAEQLRERIKVADRRLEAAVRAQSALEVLRRRADGVFGPETDMRQALEGIVSTVGGRILRSDGGPGQLDADLELPEDQFEQVLTDLETHDPPVLLLSVGARRIGEPGADGTYLQVRISGEVLTAGASQK